MITQFVEDIEEGLSFIQGVGTLTQVKFTIAQVEKCPESGRLHVQGYMQLHNPTGLQSLKKLIGNQVHFEQRRGTYKEAITYCSKEETRVAGPLQFGDAPHQGIKSDLSEVCSSIQAGSIKTVNQLMMEAPSTYCRNRNGLRDLIGCTTKARTVNFRTLTVEVYYGDAGTGKTRKVYEDNEDLYSMEQSANGSDVWFDGYEGEKTLLIDDFYGWIRFSFILKMLDGYRLKLPVKGSYTWAEWDKVIITSNAAPWSWYKWSELISWGAFFRRITKVIYFQKDKEPEEQQIHNNPHCHLNPRGSVCTCFNA